MTTTTKICSTQLIDQSVCVRVSICKGFQSIILTVLFDPYVIFLVRERLCAHPSPHPPPTSNGLKINGPIRKFFIHSAHSTSMPSNSAKTTPIIEIEDSGESDGSAENGKHVKNCEQNTIAIGLLKGIPSKAFTYTNAKNSNTKKICHMFYV